LPKQPQGPYSHATLRTMQDYLGHEIPSTRSTTPALPGIGSRGGGSSFCRQP
jgi:hypothetical protein